MTDSELTLGRSRRFTPLRSERLELRLPQPADADAVTQHLQDWDVVRGLARVPHPYRVEDAHTWIARAHQDGEELSLAICRQDLFIGATGLQQLRTRPHIGYWLAKSHWGQGFASEAAHLLLAHAFGRLDMARIYSRYHVDNRASGRVLQKLGFTITGTGMSHSLAQDKEVPHIDVELTRENYEKLNQ